MNGPWAPIPAITLTPLVENRHQMQEKAPQYRRGVGKPRRPVRRGPWEPTLTSGKVSRPASGSFCI